MDNPIALCADRNPFATVDELVPYIRRVGFDRVEWFEINEAEVWTQPETAAHLRALVRQNGITPQYHTPYDGLFDLARTGERLRTPEEVAAVVSQCLDRAERLGANLATTHLGSCPPGADRAEGMRSVVEGLRLALPELERRRVRLALENHTGAIINGPLGDHPEEFDWLMESLPSEWIGRTFDVGHAHINNHLDEFLARPFDRVFNMHLHDNNGVKDDHLPLGAGAIPWAKVLGRIADECYRGIITLEFFGTPEDYARSIEMIRRT